MRSFRLLAAVKWLIANGADVNISSEQESRTALHFAFRALNADKLANILALLEAGAGFTADSTRKTPEIENSFAGIQTPFLDCGVEFAHRL
jgi:ankyrin repeat protein